MGDHARPGCAACDSPATHTEHVNPSTGARLALCERHGEMHEQGHGFALRAGEGVLDNDGAKREIERRIYRQALERIAAEDYRGNRPMSVQIAQEALHYGDEATNA